MSSTNGRSENTPRTATGLNGLGVLQDIIQESLIGDARGLQRAVPPVTPIRHNTNGTKGGKGRESKTVADRTSIPFVALRPHPRIRGQRSPTGAALVEYTASMLHIVRPLKVHCQLVQRLLGPPNSGERKLPVQKREDLELGVARFVGRGAERRHHPRPRSVPNVRARLILLLLLARLRHFSPGRKLYPTLPRARSPPPRYRRTGLTAPDAHAQRSL
mmetsp:Transcript_17666/g.49709  ORF Transcript_17666/g.49709 Transcript_17666/m.49709 type:complete len:217 (-) Transcript_17666:760-1410(-)